MTHLTLQDIWDCIYVLQDIWVENLTIQDIQDIWDGTYDNTGHLAKDGIYDNTGHLGWYL